MFNGNYIPKKPKLNIPDNSVINEMNDEVYDKDKTQLLKDINWNLRTKTTLIDTMKPHEIKDQANHLKLDKQKLYFLTNPIEKYDQHYTAVKIEKIPDISSELKFTNNDNISNIQFDMNEKINYTINDYQQKSKSELFKKLMIMDSHKDIDNFTKQLDRYDLLKIYEELNNEAIICQKYLQDNLGDDALEENLDKLQNDINETHVNKLTKIEKVEKVE